MQFAQPIMLWALAGLSIPIAIHLLSRKEGKVIYLGSLRHLQETSTQQFRGIKLNEILLLILRSLLVILFVLVISGLTSNNSGSKRWLLVEKGVEENPIARNLIDSLTSQGFERHSLEEGFPKEKTSTSKTPINNWHLIESLQQQGLDQAIVLSHSRVEDFKGMRSAITKNIQWLTFPTSPNNFVVEAIEQSPDRVLVRNGHSEADYTSFETVITATPLPDSISVRKTPTISIALVSDSDFENDKQMMKVALLAISKTLPVNIDLRETNPELVSNLSTDWLIWLSAKSISVHDSIKVISYNSNPSDQIVTYISKNHWNINKRLTIESVRQENFTLKLATLLVDEKERWKHIAFQDRRSLQDSILFSGMTSSSTQVEAGMSPPLNKYLLILFLALLVAERFISYQRNQ
jgi:Aerotolerance regulator N-terminal